MARIGNPCYESADDAGILFKHTAQKTGALFLIHKCCSYLINTCKNVLFDAADEYDAFNEYFHCKER